METFGKLACIGFGAIGLIVCLGAVSAFLVLWAWNFVVPSLFGLREINWFEAYALSLLSSSLLKTSLRCEHT